MVVQHYTFRCDAPGCTVEAAEVTPLPLDQLDLAPPAHQLPPGWNRLNDDVLCPAHIVSYS